MSKMSSMWFREEKQKFIVSKVLSTATRTLLQIFSSLQIVILRIPAVAHGPWKTHTSLGLKLSNLIDNTRLLLRLVLYFSGFPTFRPVFGLFLFSQNLFSITKIK